MADLFTPMALRVAATLRLVDHIAAGADSAGALAAQIGADQDAMARLVAHLVTIGALADDGTGKLSLTELGEQLRSDHPADGQAWLDIDGAVGRGDLSALHLLETIRTGRPAYPLTYGRGYWEDLGANPELSQSLDHLMGSRLRLEAPALAAGLDWGELRHVVDVGGGNGTLLAAILSAHPRLRGTLVELPGPAAQARSVLADAGVSDRCEIVAGSFFEPLPAGAGGYLLSGVLHNWDDEHALAILRRCAEAAGRGGRVLVVQDIVASGPSTEMDLRMLVYMGGRERTPAELEALAERAGLRPGTVHQVSESRTVIEFLAATRRGS
jgi:2,7-dihydroxy-5-methyl-1-naphthoate 7-O-methyltransferase